MLEAKGYDKLDNDEEYKYLVKMPMDSVTEENVDKLSEFIFKDEISVLYI